MATQIQVRRDTAANWTLSNPILAQGEQGLETDTGKVKFGDGTSTWSALPYSGSGVLTLDAVTDNGSTTTNGITIGSLTVDGTTLVVDDVNDRVGIGTATPSAPIDVEGVNGVVLGRFYDGVGLASLKLTTNSNNEVGIAHAGVASGGLTFSTGSGAVGSERMRISSSGNVGIGVTDPDAKLEIQSGVVDSEVLNVRGFNADRGLNISVNNEGSITDSLVDFNNELSNGRISFSLGGGEKMRIDDSGNVGIGTDAPLSTLDVASNRNTTFTLTSTANDSGYLDQYYGKINFTSLDASNPGSGVPRAFIGASSPTSTGAAASLEFATGSSAAPTTRMLIDQLGRVGIGTDAPVAPLTVASDSSGKTLQLNADTAAGNFGTLQFSQDDGTTGNGRIVWNNSFVQLRSQSELKLQAGGNNDRLVISSSGNVGIGTTSPVNVGTAYTGLTLNNNSIGGGFVSLQSNGTETARWLTTNSLVRFGTKTTAPLEFTVGGTGASDVKMSIDASGIVSGLWSDNGTANSSGKFVKLTQAQYDALTPDANTIYFIT